jgi:DASH complex subunit DAD1
MAWLQSTPGSGRRAASPTVFEQQREELVREIAVVSGLIFLAADRLNDANSVE